MISVDKLLEVSLEEGFPRMTREQNDNLLSIVGLFIL